MHCLEREIVLDISRDALWDFIATPNNLNRLTPPELDFQIKSAVPERMYNGLTILYEITIPLFGKRRWLTEIKHIHEGHSFVDEQRLGPYRFWYHYHEIQPLNRDQCRMIDRVHYRLPLEPLSLPVHELWVKKMLQGIFAYRARQLPLCFPQSEASDPLSAHQDPPPKAELPS